MTLCVFIVPMIMTFVRSVLLVTELNKGGESVVDTISAQSVLGLKMFIIIFIALNVLRDMHFIFFIVATNVIMTVNNVHHRII